MGIWMHIHNNTAKNEAPDLGELAEVLSEVWVQMLQLHYG